MIDQSLCFGDSPLHRQHVLQTDRNLSHLESCLKTLGKALKHSIDATQQLAQCNMLVAEAIAEVGKAERALAIAESEDVNDAKQLADFIQQIAQEFMVVELNRKQFAYELEREVAEQLDSFWRADLSGVRDLKRKWEKDAVEFAHYNSKYMAKKAKDPGIFEAAQEVADARKEYHLASLDFTTRLNELMEKRVVKVHGSLARFVKLMSTFVSKQNEAIQELKGASEGLDAAAEKQSCSLEDIFRGLAEKRRKLIIDHEPIYNPLVIDRTPTPAPSPLVESENILEDEIEEDDDSVVIKEGYLYKKSSHPMRSAWSRRYFILYADKLEYFSMQEGNAPIPIDLRLCTVKPSSDTERRFCFDLVSPVKTFTLQAENDYDLEQWMEYLSMAIQEAITSSCRNHAVSDAAGSQSASIDSLLCEHRIERPMTVEELSAIKAIEGNDKCAECGDPDPKWASANHGILLCIACSGVHRGLGAQISKVRSLDLDYWEPAQIDVMKSLGNSAVNNVMEELYTNRDSENSPFIYTKPNPDSDQAIREQWVTAKYEILKFLNILPEEEAQQVLYKGLQNGQTIQVYKALQNSANPDLSGDDSICMKTPLAYALEHDQYANALLLLYAGADVNLYSEGQTPLHILARKHDSNAHCMLLTILKRHGRIDAIDKDGLAPVDVAVAAGNASAATVLRIAALADEFDELRASDANDTSSTRRRPRRHQRLFKKLTQRII